LGHVESKTVIHTQPERFSLLKHIHPALKGLGLELWWGGPDDAGPHEVLISHEGYMMICNSNDLLLYGSDEFAKLVLENCKLPNGEEIEIHHHFVKYNSNLVGWAH